MYVDALKTDKKFAADIDNLKDKIGTLRLSAKSDCGKANIYVQLTYRGRMLKLRKME